MDDYHLEHLLWRLFLESRNMYKLNLKKIYKILKAKERVNADGMIVEFEKPRFVKNFYKSSIEFSINENNEDDILKMAKWKAVKEAFFKKNKNVIKYWETPLRKKSFLKIFDKILHKCGIKLVHKPINYIDDYKYNTNILLNYREVNRMVSIIIDFDKSNLPLEMDFDTKFSEFLDSAAKKTTYFRDLDQDDIIIYDKVIKSEETTEVIYDEPENGNFGGFGMDTNKNGDINN